MPNNEHAHQVESTTNNSEPGTKEFLLALCDEASDLAKKVMSLPNLRDITWKYPSAFRLETTNFLSVIEVQRQIIQADCDQNLGVTPSEWIAAPESTLAAKMI